MNREEWLTQVCNAMRSDFQQAGARVPDKIRFTCGWPSVRAFSSKNRTIGECWDARASADGHVEVFVSPVISDGVEAGAVLVHEMVHAAGIKGHRPNFAKLGEAVGLVGPWTSTTASERLRNRLSAIAEKLGPYPHAKLDKSMRPTKKDGTRMIKLECDCCGYVVRTTKKWIDYGLPLCPDGKKLYPEGMGEEGEDDALEGVTV